MNERNIIRQAPRLERNYIINSAEGFSRRFAFLHGDFPAMFFTINFDLIYDDVLYPDYEIGFEDDCDLGCDEDGERILGSYDPTTNLICLDGVLRNTSELMGRRRTFTFWHEVGHAILHREWFIREAKRLGVNSS